MASLKPARRQEVWRVVSKTGAAVNSEELLCDPERTHSKAGTPINSFRVCEQPGGQAGGWGRRLVTAEVCSPHG